MGGQESDKDDRDKFFGKNDLSLEYYQSISRKEQPIWCKCIWVAIILGCLGATIYTVYNLLDDYFEYNSYNSDSTKWRSELALPAMTICNLNSINAQQWKEKVVDDDLEEYLNTYLQELRTLTKQGKEIPMEHQEKAVEFDKIAVDGESINIFKDLHTDFSTYLLGDGESHPFMEFADKWVDPKKINFKYIDTELGNCLSVNDDQVFVQRLSGVRGGFTIDLTTRLETYLPSTSSAGFVLYLRNPYELVLNNMDGIYLPPGKETFVELVKEEITRLTSPYGTCYNVQSMYNTTKPLTIRECIQQEYFIKFINYCECIPWYFASAITTEFESHPDNFDGWMRDNYLNSKFTYDTIMDMVCGFHDNVYCDLLVTAELEEINIDDICHEPCQYSDWLHLSASGKFPATRPYYERFLEPYIAHPEAITDDEERYAYAEANYVRVHVYYPDVKVIEITQTQDYEVFNFISEFGGATDLLIGISFFTVFQIFEIMIAYFMYKCCRKKRGEETDKKCDDLVLEGPGV